MLGLRVRNPLVNGFPSGFDEIGDEVEDVASVPEGPTRSRNIRIFFDIVDEPVRPVPAESGGVSPLPAEEGFCSSGGGNV